jgi:hypothetical protein
MDEHQKQMITACIESHHRMIAYHRRQIIELSRRMLKEPEMCKECFDFEIINESR